MKKKNNRTLKSMAVFSTAVCILSISACGKSGDTDTSEGKDAEVAETIEEDRETIKEPDLSVNEENANDVDTATSDNGWMKAYLNTLYGDYGAKGNWGYEKTTVSFVYLDDDEVPEMSVVSGGIASDTLGGIYSYADGEVVQLCGDNNALLIPGTGMIFESNYPDSMGSAENTIIKWDGKFPEQLWYGSVTHEIDDYKNEYYYTSNGKDVSEEKYNEDIAGYMELKDAISTGEDMTYHEALEYLASSLWGSSGVETAEWKEAYLKTVKDHYAEYGGVIDDSLWWGIIYVDDNDVPELIWDTGTTAGGEMVYTYHNGEVIQVYYAYSPISFVPGDGLIGGGAGHGYISESVVKLADGETIAIWAGEIDAYESYMGNFDVAPKYYVNTEEVTEEEYNKTYTDAYGGGKAFCLENPYYYYNPDFSDTCKDGTHICGMTGEEIIAYLTTAGAPEGINADIAKKYLSTIELNYNEQQWKYSYNLVYIDDDDIPELVIFFDSDGAQFDVENFSIYSYQDGGVVKAEIKTDGYGNFYIKDNVYYYEKRDYISASLGNEYVNDCSDGYGYRPVFDHSKDVLSHWNWNYFDDNDGRDVKYEAWYCDGEEIKKAEYERDISGFTDPQSLREGSISKAEITGILENVK